MNLHMVDLAQYFCNSGTSNPDACGSGNFTGFGSSYPAEQLPDSLSVVSVHDVPFLFPSKEPGVCNNMEFCGQEVLVPQNVYRKIHLLGAADNGSFRETVELLHGDQRQKIRIGLSDWLLDQPLYGERVAFRCRGIHSQNSGVVSSMTSTIWYQQVELAGAGVTFDRIQMVDNPGMHVFAMTLELMEGTLDE